MKEQPLILALDDDTATVSLVKDILSAEGYLVDTAVNGREALSRLEAYPYDLVLTDMMMPEMGGMELVQYLRLNHPDTLIIVFTGFASYQDAVDAVKLGAFDYLTKPLEPEILRHAIRRALEHQRLSRSHRDLELVFEGAEAMGWQALELVLTAPEAEVLKALRKKVGRQQDLKKVGRLILEAAPGTWCKPPVVPSSFLTPLRARFPGWRPWAPGLRPGPGRLNQPAKGSWAMWPLTGARY